MIEIHLTYFASLRERFGKSKETLRGEFRTPKDVFERISENSENLELNHFKVAINDSYSSFDAVLKDGDQICFIPPVAGG